jgi:hypothetical protein
MEYIITVAVVIIVVPILFLVLSRRTVGGAGIEHKPGDHGVTVASPSSDQPTPQAEKTVNRPAPGTQPPLPPG